MTHKIKKIPLSANDDEMQQTHDGVTSYQYHWKSLQKRIDRILENGKSKVMINLDYFIAENTHGHNSDWSQNADRLCRI